MKRLSHEFGWKSKEIVETLEAKRKVKSQEYYEAKKKAIVRLRAAFFLFKSSARRGMEIVHLLQTEGPSFFYLTLTFLLLALNINPGAPQEGCGEHRKGHGAAQPDPGQARLLNVCQLAFVGRVFISTF